MCMVVVSGSVLVSDSIFFKTHFGSGMPFSIAPILIHRRLDIGIAGVIRRRAGIGASPAKHYYPYDPIPHFVLTIEFQ